MRRRASESSSQRTSRRPVSCRPSHPRAFLRTPSPLGGTGLAACHPHRRGYEAAPRDGPRDAVEAEGRVPTAGHLPRGQAERDRAPSTCGARAALARASLPCVIHQPVDSLARLQGPRKAFEWGPVPTEAEGKGGGAAAASDAPAQQPSAEPPAPAPSESASPAAGQSSFEWGSLPAAASAEAAPAPAPQSGATSAGQSSFEWGALPAAAVPAVPAPVTTAAAAAGVSASGDASSSVDEPPGRSTFEWGPLPS